MRDGTLIACGILLVVCPGFGKAQSPVRAAANVVCVVVVLAIVLPEADWAERTSSADPACQDLDARPTSPLAGVRCSARLGLAAERSRQSSRCMNDGDNLDASGHDPIGEPVRALEHLPQPLSFVTAHDWPDLRLRCQTIATAEETLDHAPGIERRPTGDVGLHRSEVIEGRSSPVDRHEWPSRLRASSLATVRPSSASFKPTSMDCRR